MHLTLLTLSLTTSALAFFDIHPATATVKNAAHLSTLEAAYVSALQSYWAPQPQFTSAISALVEYQRTGKDVPEEVTATSTLLTYTTTPDWFNAMPTDMKNYWESFDRKNDEILASVVAEDTAKDPLRVKGDASRSMGMTVYVSGIVAVLVAGVAIGL